MTTTLLDKLLHEDMISPVEYSVMDDLMADVFRSGLITLKAFDPGKVRVMASNAMDESQIEIIDLKKRVHATIARASQLLGCDVGSIVFDLLYSPEYLEKKGSMVKLASIVRGICGVIGGGKTHEVAVSVR